MKEYDHSKIEKKWQKKWSDDGVYKTLDSKKAKTKKLKPFYVLDMFPYPSGAGLHVGHPRGYIGSDVYARVKRMQGFNVLHPMGYDAFGLPAEQYAIEHKIHPRKAVDINVKTFEKQLSIIGLSYDWSRRVNTTDTEYYRWTQWIFLQLFNSYYDTKKNKAESIDSLIKAFEKSGNAKINAHHTCKIIFSGKEWKNFDALKKQEILMNYRLAYEAESEVNWCEGLGTVLANDEIVDGKDGKTVSERGGFPVEKMVIKQWSMRITAYADRLIKGLETLEWSSHIKEIQKNWIGESTGSEIEFKIKNSNEKIKVFTTRPDTLFGVTYVVLAPESDLVEKLNDQIKNKKEVEKYISGVKSKPEDDRKNAEKEKTGVVLEGVYAINPANGEEVPVWIADYVLSSYGTGAVMAVPAHDERDFEFSKKYNLPLRQVIVPCFEDEVHPWQDGKELTRRDVVHSVLRKNNGDILLLYWKGGEWKNNHPITFIVGGIEKGENPREAAIREIKEETGYVNIKFVEQVPFSTQSKFFAAHKNVNRIADVYCVVFDLIDEERVQTKEEDTKFHDFKFVPMSEIRKEVNIKDDQFFADYLNNPSAFCEDGILSNSGEFCGMESVEARGKITKAVGGKIVTKYKMRDAIFARQRYWGEPIPLKRDKNGIISAVKKLPLELPKVTSYEPTGKAEGPLAGVKAWVKDGYETNTMPGWAGSSWYFLRYMDPKNSKSLAGENEINYWKNVDMYVGGAEHATGHLLYSRFWHKFLKDIGVAKTEEPFKKMKNQGMILASDNRKMSKRWGNVINPDEIVKTYGADTLRVYEMFMGPFDQSLPWSTESIIGSRRFIERVYRLSSKVSKNKTNPDLEKVLHKTIKKVNEDIENFAFNTAISSMMIFVNEAEKHENISVSDFKMFLQILAPFAPHFTDELWYEMGEKNSIHVSGWPKYSPKKIIEDTMKIVVQVNGKVRSELSVSIDATEDKIKEIALNDNAIISWTEGKEIKRVIYVKGRLVNIVF
ncbi:MAG: class I tRNA ligase family protein [Candidatus Pacebacteria bacterium]|nr:class I tRNA ligase family protein [Candidatus Paceibacterota bacterium]MBP9715798.1 class I tRNA ligase family protein [Candidatus Paceibacterota bacterium]